MQIILVGTGIVLRDASLESLKCQLNDLCNVLELYIPALPEISNTIAYHVDRYGIGCRPRKRYILGSVWTEVVFNAH